MLDLANGYLAGGPVTVNGVTLRPRRGATLALYPQANVIASSDAGLSVGRLNLQNPREFVLNTATRAGRIDLGAFARAPRASSGTSGIPARRRREGELLSNVPGNLAVAEITATLKLPKEFTTAGVNFKGSVTLLASAERGLILDKMTIGPANVDVGALRVNDFRIDYTADPPVWRGQGRACVAGGTCLSMIPPDGSVVFRGGDLEFAGATLFFPGEGVPLFPGVQLNRIKFNFGSTPPGSAAAPG